MARTGRQIHLYIDSDTNQRLMELVSKTPKKEITTVIEDLIRTGTIIETPSADYFSMMKELHFIGHNLNQIAFKANATGDIDAAEYERQAGLLRDAVLRIQQAIELADKRE